MFVEFDWIKATFVATLSFVVPSFFIRDVLQYLCVVVKTSTSPLKKKKFSIIVSIVFHNASNCFNTTNSRRNPAYSMSCFIVT